MLVITDKVIVATNTAAKDTAPPLLKFMYPDFMILFNSVIILLFVMLGVSCNLTIFHGNHPFSNRINYASVVGG